MYNDRDHKLHNRNELLTVSFGTTSAESRLHNIDAVEQAIKDAVGDDWIVRRCFTSQTIINLIHKREGIRIDSVEEALQKAKARGTRNMVIQPTHLMKGLEYEKIKVIISEFERDMVFASVMDTEESRTLIVRNAVNKNIKNMYYVLNDKQYKKYLMLLNLTLENRGFDMTKISK